MAATKVGIYRSPDRSQVWITTDDQRQENTATHVAVGAGRWLVKTNEVKRADGTVDIVHRLILQTGRRDERVVESSNRELIASTLSHIMALAPGTGCVLESIQDKDLGRVRITKKTPASTVLSVSTDERGTAEHESFKLSR